MTRLHPWLVSLAAIFLAQVSAVAQPLIVAHRGLLRHAPENTLANFRACLELRLGFELDVQRSKDGHLICIHDSTADRTTNGKGKVSEMTLAQIKKLDAGGWFDPKFAGEKVPTIDEVFKLIARYRQHHFLIAVDLKAEKVEQDVVRLAIKHDILPRLLFIGRTITQPTVRRAILAVSKKAQVGAVANDEEDLKKAVADVTSNWVYCRFLASQKQIETAHRAGKKVFIAGPKVSGNVAKNWQHCATVGIDAILTDYPLALRSVLKNGHERKER